MASHQPPAPPWLIVIGASAGGVEALQQLVAGLPRDLDAAVCTVVHVWAGAPSYLPELLIRAGPLPAMHVIDGMPIASRTIFVAPPDHHMVVDDGTLRLSRGPR